MYNQQITESAHDEMVTSVEGFLPVTDLVLCPLDDKDALLHLDAAV